LDLGVLRREVQVSVGFDGSGRTAAQSLAPGRFVDVADDPRGVGLLLSVDPDGGEVEFFHSATRSEVHWVPSLWLERTFLSPQTRVYFRLSDERWRMGRVRNFFLEDNGSVTYEVRLPNKQDIDVPEAALRIRALTGAWDPTEVLALGASETQRWFDARWPAREALVGLRAAARGLTGIASASVELVGHQLDAVRRVLHDPLQRYLLADEVGLGKTIEACAILRQTLVDDAEATALVLTPPALTAQWERELTHRFDLTPGRGGRVRVLPHGALGADIPAPTILVVDEAHKIDVDTDAFQHLARLSRLSPKLLLLSATPTIGHEAALLALLRLLDPERWADESTERFAEHVARSQEYGRLLLGLRADASAFVLRQRVAGALSLFPDDTVVAELGQQFQGTEDAGERIAVCSRLRQHIADTYRIHQRLIRNRRADLDGWEFQPRGPATVRMEEDDDPSLQQTLLALEDWRAQALVAAEAAPGLTAPVADRYQQLQQALSAGSLEAASLDPMFDGEATLLQAIAEAMGDDARQRRAAFVAEVAQRHLRFLRPASGAAKLVVFASDQDFAVAIGDALRDSGVDSLFDSAEGQDVAADFAGSACASIAVFGPEGEEGLNLHFADAILHADLPASVSRLEQRIGRLDRFGRTRGPIKHIVVAPAAEDDTSWTAWCDLLRDGFGIFDRPVSDIQFVLSEIEIEVGRRMLLGPQALLDFRAELSAVVAQHRERLDEQYAMDQLAMARDAARALADAFEDAEADEEDLQRRVGGLLTTTLQLGIRRDDSDTFVLGWGPNTQLPERPWRAIFSPGLGRPLTWKRRLSVARPQIGLLRPGSSLIDALERLLEWDDRGAAFATWRLQPGAGGPGQERLAFRLCWVVGPGAMPADLLQPGEDAESLHRQAEGFLQPWTLTQHVGPDLQPIDDRDWLEILERPYQAEAATDGCRDFNLGSRPEWLHQVIDRTAFADLCAQVTASATVTLQSSSDFRQRVSDAQTRSQHEMERRASRRGMRGHLDTDTASARAAALDGLVCDLVARPRLRLDCIGAFVVSGYVPQVARR
jgi:ATP-dependent helicase HepA